MRKIEKAAFIKSSLLKAYKKVNPPLFNRFQAVQNSNAIFFRFVIAIFKSDNNEKIRRVFGINQSCNHNLNPVFVT